jgi:hypothetical protein
MTDAVGQSIDAWILYGDSIGSSLKKATAAVLAQIAAQSLVKAIFETAEGIASLAVGNFGGAALHFEAAAGYGLLAAGAALGGKALAGGKDKKKSSGGGSYSYGSGSNINQNPTPYSRASKDAYISGRIGKAIRMLSIAILPPSKSLIKDRFDASRRCADNGHA